MKKLTSILIIFCITACAINNNIEIKREYTNKLPSLELIFEGKNNVVIWTKGQKIFRESNDIATIFYDEMETNVTDTSDIINGYIKLKLIKMDSSEIGPWNILNALTFQILTLLGLPTETIKVCVKIQVDIFDKDNNLIKSYNETIEDTFNNNIYNEYQYRKKEAKKLVFQKAVKRVIEKIHKDKKMIINKLK